MAESRAQTETDQVEPPSLVFRSSSSPLLVFPQRVPQTADRAQRPAIFIGSQGLFKLACKILWSYYLYRRKRSRSEYRLDQLRCLGEREHFWGAPHWDQIARAGTLSAWLAPDRAIALRTVRPAGAEGTDDSITTETFDVLITDLQMPSPGDGFIVDLSRVCVCEGKKDCLARIGCSASMAMKWRNHD